MNKKIIVIIILIIIFSIGTSIVILNKERKENLQYENSNIDLSIDLNTNLPSNNSVTNEQTNPSEINEEENKVENIKIKVDNQVLNVKLEKNSATEALVEKLKQGELAVNTHEYGGFEQVGSLGFSLPREDTQITTKSGDLMLYQGNQITLFYGSNSWSYTKLGEVINKSNNELKNILGNGDITLVLSIN